MIVDELELINFRKHRRLKLSLKTGITGIIGDNGTGKSSIVEALLFVLTGELFEGTKASAITLGCDDGWVRLKFTLNGKKGSLIRYLHGPTPKLNYDNLGTKKKSGDVKELWESLLQVGPEIISKVIIAKQGDIPMLFSGSATIREKIFQKIFLVPNTEKVRSMINKNYLSQLPPMLYVESDEDLAAQIHSLETKISKYEFDLNALKVLPTDVHDRIKDRIKFLNKCEQDAGALIILEQDRTRLQDSIKEYDKAIEALEVTLGSIQIDDYVLQRDTQLQQKVLFGKRLTLQKEYNDLKATTLSPQDILIIKEELATLTTQVQKARDDVVKTKVAVETLTTQLERYQTLTDGSVCHTCGQPLHSVHALIDVISQELLEANAKYKEGRQAYDKLKACHTDLSATVTEAEEALAEYARVSKNLAQFEDITFDEATLVMYGEVIEQYKEYEAELAELKLNRNSEVNRLNLVNNEIKNLAFYDSDKEKLELERERHIASLSDHEEAVRQQQILQVELKTKQIELSQVLVRKANSKENSLKNKKRNRYSELLGIALDTLATQNIPRNLIMNYADVVTEYLQEKLQCFNIPYTPKLSDKFKIEMYTEDNQIVPTVSGGQEMQIGISLHLALHELFSQSFPLLVIDEGTTHLDTTNRKAYFEIIKKLKANEKLQQILIIDHDEGLSTVVDNVINLNEL